jgi:hypothetical protein
MLIGHSKPIQADYPVRLLCSAKQSLGSFQINEDDLKYKRRKELRDLVAYHKELCLDLVVPSGLWIECQERFEGDRELVWRWLTSPSPVFWRQAANRGGRNRAWKKLRT